MDVNLQTVSYINLSENHVLTFNKYHGNIPV